MDITSFEQGIEALVKKTNLFGEENLEVVMIENLHAGGFSRPARAAQALKEISTLLETLSSVEDRKGKTNFSSIQTTRPRHASVIAASLIDESAIKPNVCWFVIMACGDGTSYEFLDELSRAPDSIRNKFTVIRLPMGTGNDGSDGRELSDTLSRIVGKGKIATQSVLRVIPNPNGPAAKRAPNGEWRSFNIASIGLDAYVTHMTNKLKSKLPGDSYKLWLDLSSVLYEKAYPLGNLVITGYDDNGVKTKSINGKFIICAMGVSGHRTYGSNQMILQTDDNVCAVRAINLFGKLAMQKALKEKTIHKIKEAEVFSARKIEITNDKPILVQMDGEAELLVPEDFPLQMINTEPLIKHIAHI